MGTVVPIKEVAKLAHEHGAKLMVDGAQAVMHMPVNVQDLDCDFYAFTGHKIYGPSGIGVLYGKAELLDAMPPFLGGGDMILSVTMEKSTWAALPAKFEAGTPPIAQAIGLGAALEYVSGIGLEGIAAHEIDLLNYATQQLSSIDGLRIIGTAPNKTSVISFTMDGAHPHGYQHNHRSGRSLCSRGTPLCPAFDGAYGCAGDHAGIFRYVQYT